MKIKKVWFCCCFKHNIMSCWIISVYLNGLVVLIDMRNVKRNWCRFWRKLASIPKKIFILCPAQDWLEQTLKNSQNSALGICMYHKFNYFYISYVSIKAKCYSEVRQKYRMAYCSCVQEFLAEVLEEMGSQQQGHRAM